MSVLKFLSSMVSTIRKMAPAQSSGFSQEQYDKENQACIDAFNAVFDLNDPAQIMSITVADIQSFSAKARGVPSEPMQILLKKATEHKKNGQIDLAIVCLKKVNELLPVTSRLYQRSDFERLVNYLILADKFDEAKEEHLKLDRMYGAAVGDAKERKDREEYYWLLENHKSEAPKSFGAYRKMKADNTEKYKSLKEIVNRSGFKLNSVRFWLQW